MVCLIVEGDPPASRPNAGAVRPMSPGAPGLTVRASPAAFVETSNRTRQLRFRVNAIALARHHRPRRRPIRRQSSSGSTLPQIVGELVTCDDSITCRGWLVDSNTEPAQTRFVAATDDPTASTVVFIGIRIDAHGTAPRLPRSAGTVISANAIGTVRRCSAADVAAGAAVVRIGIQQAAHAVAFRCALDARIMTAASDAFPKLIGSGIRAAEAAAAAIVEVVLQVGAVRFATRFSEVAAVIATGPAVWIGS